MSPVESWFARRRLGLFLHFGLYAIEGWHEQDQMRRRIPAATYTQLAERFDPSQFDADAILDLAESVGMEYVCLTTKHHDGFCLWDTAHTRYNVMNTPLRRDLVRELADACHRRNVALGLYYSIADWHHPNYPNQGRHHELAGPKPGDEPNWERYMDFVRRQVRELCTNYGEIRQFFWDINVPEHVDPSVNAMIRELQPTAVINDRGFDDGDFGTPEREYSAAETQRLLRFSRPTEACNSVGTQSWGFRLDEDYYSCEFLAQSIDTVMAKGGHYLLNVGPDATGRIPERAAEILRRIGGWYLGVQEAFGDSEPASDLTTNRGIWLTRRGQSLYVHIPSPPTAEAVLLPPIDQTPIRAVLLNTGESLRTSTEVLPSYWSQQAQVLRITGLPTDRLVGGPLIVRLDFDAPLTRDAERTVTDFQG